MLNFSARKGDFKHGHSTDAGGQRLQGLVLQKSLRRRKGKSIMVAGVPRAKLQDADAHGDPLGWSTVASISFIANNSFRSQLTNLLQRIHSRILCGRGGRIQDATFLSFWRHGANYFYISLLGINLSVWQFCLLFLGEHCSTDGVNLRTYEDPDFSNNSGTVHLHPLLLTITT